jgi:hypothetical protein
VVNGRPWNSACILPLNNVHFIFQVVRAFQHHVHDGGGHHNFCVAHAVQQVLHCVRDLLDGAQIKKAGKPFDGMKSAKDGVDGLRRCRVLFQRQRMLFNLIQVLAGLQNKVRQ